MRKTLAGIATAGLLAAGLVAAAPRDNPNTTPDNEQVTKLLAETKTIAFQLKEDAVIMESFNRMNVSHETHAAMINQIRDHVNELGKRVAKLNEVKGLASPWQRAAIDRMVPFLDELAGYTTAVIEHLSGTERHTPEEYKDYLEANADYASDLARMIADFVDYGQTKNRLERLSEKLEIPKK